MYRKIWRHIYIRSYQARIMMLFVIRVQHYECLNDYYVCTLPRGSSFHHLSFTVTITCESAKSWISTICNMEMNRELFNMYWMHITFYYTRIIVHVSFDCFVRVYWFIRTWCTILSFSLKWENKSKLLALNNGGTKFVYFWFTDSTW